MNDDKRILEQGATSLEALMLSSARHEEPGEALERRMMAPLLAIPTLPPAPGAGVDPTTTTVAFKWTSLSIGALSLSVAGATAWWALSEQPQPAPRPVAPASAPAQAQAAPTHEEAREEAPLLPQEIPEVPKEPAEIKQLTHQPVVSAESARAPTSTKPEKASTTLNVEMQMLDRARSALSRGDHDKALAILGQYEQKYPKGVLKPEATVLRVGALSAAGNTDQADDLKQDFLKKHPTSAHRRRLENGAEGPTSSGD